MPKPAKRNRATARSGEKATATPEQTARQIGVGINQVYDGLHAGQIPAIRNGRRFLIPQRWIERVLDGVEPLCVGSSED
jgi:excisionase family DNA binding protein